MVRGWRCLVVAMLLLALLSPSLGLSKTRAELVRGRHHKAQPSLSEPKGTRSKALRLTPQAAGLDLEVSREEGEEEGRNDNDNEEEEGEDPNNAMEDLEEEEAIKAPPKAAKKANKAAAATPPRNRAATAKAAKAEEEKEAAPSFSLLTSKKLSEGSANLFRTGAEVEPEYAQRMERQMKELTAMLKGLQHEVRELEEESYKKAMTGIEKPAVAKAVPPLAAKPPQQKTTTKLPQLATAAKALSTSTKEALEEEEEEATPAHAKVRTQKVAHVPSAPARKQAQQSHSKTKTKAVRKETRKAPSQRRLEEEEEEDESEDEGGLLSPMTSTVNSALNAIGFGDTPETANNPGILSRVGTSVSSALENFGFVDDEDEAEGATESAAPKKARTGKLAHRK